jgi:hypothetical protein
VRFEDLEGRSRLPIERLRNRFRYEVVLAVLPARGGRDGTRETLLVATETMLAVITSIAFPRGSWMTQWAPWDVVEVPSGSQPGGVADRGEGPSVRVGDRQFRARDEDEVDRRAFLEFAVVVRAHRRGAGRAVGGRSQPRR